MKTLRDAGCSRAFSVFLSLAVVPLIAMGVALTSSEAGAHGRHREGGGRAARVCSTTARVAYKACGKDVQDNRLIAEAKCLNVSDADERDACFEDARSTSQDERGECEDVRDARLGVCEALTIGGGPYDPEIDPTRFVAADAIDGNGYFPLKPGTEWVYQNTDDETITVTVTDETVEISGVPARVVTDVVVDGDGHTTEDTQDWFAEDVDGNVWYFGERTIASDPESLLATAEGSWETGVDGAKPGIVMPAVFVVGDVYRQEFLLGDAEDIAENLSQTETESVPEGGPTVASCDGDCLETHEYTPIEPDQSESKFYAKDVGVILTLDDNDPSFREELVSFTPAP